MGDVVELGIIIDILDIVLKRNNLRGNAFQCVRTFHLVQLLSDFIQSSQDKIVPEGGISQYKQFQQFMQKFLHHLANITEESYQKHFNGFVSDLYMGRIRNCFREAKECKLLDLLFTAPRSYSHDPEVELSVLESKSDDADVWKSKCIIEGRLGMTLHNLLNEDGVSITPRISPPDSFSFDTNDQTSYTRCRTAMDRLKKELQKESPTVDVKLKCQSERFKLMLLEFVQ